MVARNIGGSLTMAAMLALKESDRQLEAKMNESKWQPIKTAPQNMKDVLVYAPKHGIFIAQCVDKDWVRSSSDRLTPHDDFFGDGNLGITHWMPLPEPPK